MRLAKGVTPKHAASQDDLGWGDWEAKAFVAVLTIVTAAAGLTVWICVSA